MTVRYGSRGVAFVEGPVANEMGVHLPTSDVAAYVRSTGHQTWDSEYLRQNLVTTLDAGLARVRAGFGQSVVVLPGHVENIDSADKMSSLVAGTNIVCLGSGDNRPTFTWTAAAASFLFDVDDVHLYNAVLYLAAAGNGGVEVVAPITVSGDGCGIHGCDIYFGADGDDVVTIGITVTGDRFDFMGNHCIGATVAECTTFMDLNGADRFRAYDNIIEGATDAVAVGLMRFVTAASLNVDLRRNTYINRKALSTCCVTGLAGVSGVSRDESFNYLDTTSLTAWLTSTGIMVFHNPRVTNTAGHTGSAVVGTVSS